MNFNLEAAVLALAGIAVLPVGAAEAKTWRQWAHQYGGGNYVDKYANDYVGEDKNGKTYYKGSKHDTYSGEYYNNKTGKWTGKHYDGKHGGPASTEYSSNGTKKSKSNTASVRSNSAGSSKTYAKASTGGTTAKVVSQKPGAAKTYAAKPATAGVKPVSNETMVSKKAVTKSPVDEVDAEGADALEAAPAPKGVKPQARLLPEAEMYGPPMPPEFETAQAQ